MRFCPFCSAENADELAVCQACGRRLPPLPPRRAGSKGQPTGVQLPPRAAAAPPPIPRKASPTQPPPIPPSAPQVARDSAPSLPPPPAIDERQQLLDALSPPPAAERRPPPPSQPPPMGEPARRKSDSAQPPMRPGSGSQPPPIANPAPRPKVPTRPPPAAPHLETFGDIDTAPTGAPFHMAVTPSRTSSFSEPPPTRVQQQMGDRPFTPPKVLPVPEIPEPGLVNAARYAYFFWRARWQRRGAIRQLGVEIKQDTEALDQVLGSLGRAARGANVEGRVFSAENSAISEAEGRINALKGESGEADRRKAEESSKFVDVERERTTKLSEAERQVEEVQRELSHLEAQRRSERDKRKELERRQKAHLKAAEDHDRQATTSQMGDQRNELRRTAEGHRREAGALDPERQELDRRLSALDRPISEATAKLDAAKAELDAAKRSLNDAREGHTHRLAELDAEQKRKAREVALAESEIARRLVTLGTLVNLNRIEDGRFAELYERIDRLRGAITARTTEIEKLTAEREAYDRGTLVRGIVTIGGAFVALIALIVIFRAIL
jgi:hypothetical protein